MSSFIQLILLLSLILTVAKIGGILSAKIRQPAVFGELLAGVILGPSVFNILQLPFVNDTHLLETIKMLGEIGVLFLMFLAGLELHLADLIKSAKVSALAGTLGVVVPILLGLGVGVLLGEPVLQSIFLGIALAATSVSISAQTLLEMNKLQTRIGLSLLGAAVFDDILVILVLSAFLALATGGGSFLQIVLLFLRMLTYLVASILLGRYFLPWVVNQVTRLHTTYLILVFAIIVIFIYGATAEIFGQMAAITGAFISGLMFGRTTQKQTIEMGIKSLAYGFFVPIFFVSIGISINLREIPLNYIWTILLVILIAVAGKIIGCGLGAKLSKFNNQESLQLGVGMISRGEVGLIVANIGVANSLINNDLFIAIVAVVLFTTLLTPVLLRLTFRKEQPDPTNVELPVNL